MEDYKLRDLRVSHTLGWSWNWKSGTPNKDYYQVFFWVLIDLIVELLGLIIKPFDNQTES